VFVVEAIHLRQQFNGPELAVTSYHLTARYDITSRGICLSLRKTAAFQNQLLSNSLLIIVIEDKVGHDSGVSLRRALLAEIRVCRRIVLLLIFRHGYR
jgi:hypothetical protein